MSGSCVFGVGGRWLREMRAAGMNPQLPQPNVPAPSVLHYPDRNVDDSGFGSRDRRDSPALQRNTESVTLGFDPNGGGGTPCPPDSCRRGVLHPRPTIPRDPELIGGVLAEN